MFFVSIFIDAVGNSCSHCQIYRSVVLARFNITSCHRVARVNDKYYTNLSVFVFLKKKQPYNVHQGSYILNYFDVPPTLGLGICPCEFLQLFWFIDVMQISVRSDCTPRENNKTRFRRILVNFSKHRESDSGLMTEFKVEMSSCAAY
jgi:hypothetical protein